MKLIGEAPTRVANLLLELGPATVSDLATTMKLTPAAIRKHLDVLEAAELVSSHEEAPYGPAVVASHGKGRPAKFFALTDLGRQKFAPPSDRLAENAVDFIYAELGESGIKRFAEDVFSKVASEVDSLEGLVDQLQDAGYCPSVKTAPNGLQISLRNCPISAIASKHRDFCEIEARLLGERLGANVVQISTIASGAAICTMHVANPNPRRSA